jgi:hypothetical protein
MTEPEYQAGKYGVVPSAICISQPKQQLEIINAETKI